MKQPYNAIEVIHRDYNVLSDFIHTKEIDGEYTDTHFEKLDSAIFDYLDKEDRLRADSLIEQLTDLIESALNTLEAQTRRVQKGELTK